MKFFDPNITSRGRLIRAFGASALTGAAVLIVPNSRALAAGCGAIAAFMFFESARGWCIARACGIKTPF